MFALIDHLLWFFRYSQDLNSFITNILKPEPSERPDINDVIRSINSLT